MRIFFTADMHLNHANVIDFCKRPFTSVEEMNEKLIENWNSVVTKKDCVYVLGDVAWRNPHDLIKRLNGKKILIRGNHDNFGLTKALRYGFSEVHEMHKIKIDGNNITMCHYPMHSWYKSHKGTYHIHGHIHEKIIPFMHNRYNVGVDVNDYTPVSYEDLMEIFKNQKLSCSTQHEEELDDC